MQSINNGRPATNQVCIFCYHKVGTILLSRIFQQLCMETHSRFQGILGKHTQLPQNADLVFFAHSLIDLSAVTSPFTGVHFIRDPRDIIVSGYLYHFRTSERWCINTDLSQETPILFPRVPRSQLHRPEEWKAGYLESLGGKSYQQNLSSVSRRDGLLFEMNNYAAWTIESMREWDYSRDDVLEIKFEDLMAHYDDTFHKIFNYLGYSEPVIELGMQIAAAHDLGRKSAAEIEDMSHVSSARTSKWKDYFEPEHKEAFIDKFRDVLIELGYESSNDW